ncbi:hypothetical protein NE237_031707 [Protea cynaroides]|uniref:Uncharacterized protein n=1 Tax=Protea cynaroides TaxID=273540 RepID=A0A9Q0L227_9MAGN|nr:hypothetical protein NE237_031707 [Protea cynaroides]
MGLFFYVFLFLVQQLLLIAIENGMHFFESHEQIKELEGRHGPEVSENGQRLYRLGSKMRPSSPLEAMSPEVINTWELMAGLEEDEEEKQQQSRSSRVERSASVGKRSKSFHWLPEGELPAKASFKGTKEYYGIEQGYNNKVITQSVHETFDEMVERNWMPEAREAKSQDLLLEDGCGSKLKACEDANENSVEVYVKEESHIIGIGGQENAIKELNAINEVLMNRPRLHQQNEVELVVEVNSTSSNAIKTERGLRRKAMASGLTTLRIPTDDIDFPATTSLKQWLDVTPKFGTFPLPIPVNENQCNEDSVFDQEIVKAFEEAMQQLQAEEECILRQIIENSMEGSIKEKDM